MRRQSRSCTSDNSEGGERLNQSTVVSHPQFDPIHDSSSFEEDGPPNGMWM